MLKMLCLFLVLQTTAFGAGISVSVNEKGDSRRSMRMEWDERYRRSLGDWSGFPRDRLRVATHR